MEGASAEPDRTAVPTEHTSIPTDGAQSTGGYLAFFKDRVGIHDAYPHGPCMIRTYVVIPGNVLCSVGTDACSVGSADTTSRFRRQAMLLS